MAELRITYAPRPDATPQVELAALAAIYEIALETEKAAGRSLPDGDDTKEGSVHDFRASNILRQ